MATSNFIKQGAQIKAQDIIDAFDEKQDKLTTTNILPVNTGGTGRTSLNIPYGRSTVAAGTQAKTVTTANLVSDVTFSRVNGIIVGVIFTNANTNATPTLNIASSGTSAILFNGVAPTSSPQMMPAETMLYFQWNGTNWILLNPGGTLPVAQGGTGVSSFTANSAIISGNTTTAALTTRAIAASVGTSTTSTDLVTAGAVLTELNLRNEYTFVIDSNVKLQAWANNTNPYNASTNPTGNDYSRILIKAGNWTLTSTLSGGTNANPLAVIDLSGASGKPNTKSIVGESGSKVDITNEQANSHIIGIKGNVTGTYPNFTNPGNDYFFSNVNLRMYCNNIAGSVGYSFSNCANLLNCTGNDSIGTSVGNGFTNCTNLSNCTGYGANTVGNVGNSFTNCTNLSNCNGIGEHGGIGFSNCTNLSNCTGTGYGNNIGGFTGCANLSNCNGTGGTVADCHGFLNCTRLSNCTGSGGTGLGNHGFNNCSRLSNCTGTGSDNVGNGFYNCRTGFGNRGTYLRTGTGISYMNQDTTGNQVMWNNDANGGWNLGTAP